MMNTTAPPPILERLTALGDETRTRILALLERSELTVTELSSVLRVPQPTVSRHLKTLSAEGWVEARADGRNRHYRLRSDLDAAAMALWRIVREEVTEGPVYLTDAERAREVLERRRLRSAEFFARAAAHWDEVREELFGRTAAFAPLLGLVDPDWIVADLGTGTGALLERLAPFARRVIGVDRSEEMLAAARHRLAPVPNAELRQGELERLPVEDEELDVAILALVLHYVVDPRAVLREVHRALRPGGRALVVDMRRHEGGRWLDEEMGHVWPGFEPGRMRAWLDASGFACARAVPLPPDPGARGPLLFLASGTKPSA
ncbi:MAG TPA: metalloregulator ArsR/SmtB family transcription factor [Longimicrobiales bacterium]|nr:metalloregulator ArsR/SmtB family transcription factor [Longimicrobiales bacterium]